MDETPPAPNPQEFRQTGGQFLTAEWHSASAAIEAKEGCPQKTVKGVPGKKAPPDPSGRRSGSHLAAESRVQGKKRVAFQEKERAAKKICFFNSGEK